MKKKYVLVCLLSCFMLLLPGCGNTVKENTVEAETENQAEPEEEGSKAEEQEIVYVEDSNQGDIDPALKLAGMDEYIVDYSAAINVVLSKTWAVEGEQDIYFFDVKGNGYRKGNDEEEVSFTYASGFDKDKRMMLYISYDESKESEKYFITPDETGYKIYMEDVEDGSKKVLTPDDLEILTPEAYKAMLGTWVDDNKNEYEFTEDGQFLIKNREDSNGTFCVVENKEDGIRTVSIFVAGGTLQYEYEVQDDGDTLELYNRPSETYYYWHKEAQ